MKIYFNILVVQFSTRGATKIKKKTIIMRIFFQNINYTRAEASSVDLHTKIRYLKLNQITYLNLINLLPTRSCFKCKYLYLKNYLFLC